MLFGDGIFGADGDTWQLQRKLGMIASDTMVLLSLCSLFSLLAIPLFKKHSLDSMKAVFHDKATIVMVRPLCLSLVLALI